jgi:NADPH2:quinone reductase
MQAMSHAIRVHRYGGPDALQWEPVELDAPGRGQVQLRHTAIGLNFIDVYERTGLYQGPLPITPGREAAGVVEVLGPDVSNLQVGDRVVYVSHDSGAYSQRRNMPANRLVKLPAQVDDQVAAALFLKGLTAQFLLRQTYRVGAGDYVLIHAAAGGVGSLAVQWAKHLGAVVIAVVGSQAKADRARGLGAQHVLLDRDDWVAQVRSITSGHGVHVVYDSVGKATFSPSLDCLRRRGMMVSYGNASGPVPPVAPLELSRRGSLFLTRPTLFDYIALRSELEAAAEELFDLQQRGVISVHVDRAYPLSEAARAHSALEARETSGSTVLLP